MRSIEHEIRRFITENFLYGRPLEFSGDDSFLEMGLIDSTGILELVSFLEKQYQITVEDVDLVPENLDSIAQLASFVERKQALHSAGATSQFERSSVSTD